MGRRRLFWQLYPGYVAVILLGLVSIGWYSLGSLREFYFARLAVDLEAKARLLEHDLLPMFREPDPGDIDRLCNTLGARSRSRITVMIPSGEVIGDTNADPAEMDNHATRPEILEALSKGLGKSIIVLNRAAAALFKVDPEEVRNRLLQEVIRNAAIQSIVSQLLSGEEPIDTEVHLPSKPERVLQVRGSPLTNTQGQQMGTLIAIDDITRLRHLEAVRRDFVANVSHELKTPITSIKGFMETLRDGAVDEPEARDRFLDIISKEAARLDSIIEDLLSLSKIEEDSRQGWIHVEKCKIEDAVKAAVQDCEPKADRREVEIRVECDEGTTALINPRLIEQAVANLIDNATKYSDKGSVVRVEVERSDSSVEIHVHDDGCGIEMEHHKRLFERFYRVDKARSRKLGGTGLGLAIVKHIAEAHGGTVSIKSAPGAGSRFTIHLPCD